MKTENKTSNKAVLKLLLIMPVIAILIIAFASCGKEKSAQASLADQVYIEVDEMPVFPNGDQGILKFIAENTIYPEKAVLLSITGRVLVRFVVEKDGSISEVAIEKGVDPALDAEAVRVVSSLPKFEKPGIKAGEKVRVQYMLPITFALK
jgi:protein TonB